MHRQFSFIIQAVFCILFLAVSTVAAYAVEPSVQADTLLLQKKDSSQPSTTAVENSGVIPDTGTRIVPAHHAAPADSAVISGTGTRIVPAHHAAPADSAVISAAGNERFDFADGLYARNMYSLAAAEYNELVKNYPNHPRTPDAYFRLAESLFFLNQTDEALKNYRLLIEKHPAHSQAETAKLRTGEILYKQGLKEEAIKAFEGLKDSSVVSIASAASYYAAKIYFETDRLNNAEKDFKTIEKQDEENPFWDIANYYLGQIAVQRQQYDQAKRHFTLVIGTEKEELKQLALFAIAQVFFLSKSYEDAAENFKKAYQNDTDKNLSEEAFLNYLKSLYEAHQYTEVIKEYTGIKLTGPEKKFTAKMLAANSHFQLKQLDQAESLFNQILKIPGIELKDKETAELGKMEVLLNQEDASKALQTVQTMSAQRNFFEDRWDYLHAEIMIKAGQPKEALKLLQNLIQKFPQSEYVAQAMLTRSFLLADMQLYEDARNSFDEFLRTFSNHPLTKQAFLNRINLDIKLEDWEVAEKNSLSFLEKYPESDEAEIIHYQLGSIYLQLKKYSDAYEVYRTHLKKFDAPEKEGEILFFRGYTKQLDGKFARAIHFYQRVQKGYLQGELFQAALKNTAYCYIQLEDFDHAAEVYLELLGEYPEEQLSADIYLWLCDYFQKAGDGKKLQTAVNSFAQSKAASNHTDSIEYYLGEAGRLNQKYDEALPHYLKSIEQNKGFIVESLLGQAQTYSALKKYDSAVELFSKCITQAYENPMLAIQAKLGLAEVYGYQENFLEAAKTYFAIAILYDDDTFVPKALYDAGQAFEKAGKPEEALQAYHELAERFPKHELNSQARSRLNELSAV
ncbi:MAG: tetratricopeptide repeat protein [Candidatus Omnitrophica bacterium]|nr:tetratricopeptide repeat protein [Candidatus Omnitrophota bacterium]